MSYAGPSFDSRLGTSGHQPDQSVNVLTRECRLDHRPRAAPDISVADDQPVTEQHLDALETRPFHVLRMSARQDTADFDGIVDKIRQSAIGFLEANHIPVVTLHRPERLQRFRIDTECYGLLGSRRPPVCALGVGHGYRQDAGLPVVLLAQ